jgi:uncharacterized protein (DUF2267 family)
MGATAMSTTALDVFDTTLEKTNEWLNAINQELGWENKHAAYAALRGTLHALRDRLGVNEAAKLGAQLPMLVRGIYYEGWHPGGKPLKLRHREEFLDHVARESRTDFNVPIATVARAVLAVLARHVTEGEVTGILRTLPSELRTLWPADIG